MSLKPTIKILVFASAVFLFWQLRANEVFATCSDPGCTSSGYSVCMNKDSGTYYCSPGGTYVGGWHSMQKSGGSCTCDKGQSPPCEWFYHNSWSSACGTCCGGGPSRPCGDCIPDGCGFSSFSPEKKFVQDMKNENEPNRLIVAASGKSEWLRMNENSFLNGGEKVVIASVNLESEETSTSSPITVAKVAILEWFRGLFRLIVKTVFK